MNIYYNKLTRYLANSSKEFTVTRFVKLYNLYMQVATCYLNFTNLFRSKKNRWNKPIKYLNIKVNKNI